MANTINQPNIVCPHCEHVESEGESIIAFAENESDWTKECEECSNQYIVHVDCKFTTVRKSV